MILGLDISTSITGATILDDDGNIVLCEAWDMRDKKHFKDLFDKRAKQDAYDTDQAFLREDIYPRVAQNAMVHDEFFSENSPFPTSRQGLEFVGQVFDEDDETVAEHIQALHGSLPDINRNSSARSKGLY